MSSSAGPPDDENLLVQKCLARDPDALEILRENYLQPLRGVLVSRGAGPVEADDLSADIWADCVMGRPERPPLLERFNGRASLKNWLFRVGINAFIDIIRRPKPLPLSPSDSETDEGVQTEPMRSVTQPLPESGLVALLRTALERGFQSCAAEGLLMLRLVYLHDLSQREVAAMWGCHEARVSRSISSAMDSIRQRTLDEIHKVEPRLKLSWEDILELCRAEPLEFIG